MTALWLGYDPTADTSFLVRRYADGTFTVATRPGENRRDLIWSPEVALAVEA